MYLKTFVQQVRIAAPRPAIAMARPYSMIPSTPLVSATNPTSGSSDTQSMYATKADQEEVHSTVYVSGEQHTADVDAPFIPSVNHVFDD
jgi:hypothetical protein